MKTLLSYLTLALLAVFTGCGLKTVIGPNGIISDAGTTSTSTSTTQSTSYQPITAGSNWKYNLTLLGTTQTAVITITGNVKTFNGKTYYEGKEVAGSMSSIGYFSHKGGLYTNRTNDADPQDVLDEPYLVDSLAMGGTYTYKGNDAGLSHGSQVRYLGTIIEKNTSKVVNGKNYANVIHTHLDLQYDNGSGFTTSETYEYYVAKGIGIIELDDSLLGVVVASQILVSYTIK